ncbi:T-cell surface antigen CD2-like [Centropristis striata]|uniref:T-cell surface antigen CD2-like n=1 Tax=Centropristis striata TaxID=184440 RepID=UPI0027DF3752|nr:T-cell surface antigen CD2-like [Centropristis striata]
MMRMVMKMAAVSSISLLLLCCCFISSTDSEDICIYAAAGDNYIVPLIYKMGEGDSLSWKRDTETIFSKKKAVVITGKKEDISADGSLKLTNLKKSNSGTYTPEVFGSNGKKIKETLKSTTLCVLDRVLKPKVTIDNCKAKSVRFTCFVPQDPKDSKLDYVWLQNNKVLPLEKSKTLTRTELQLEPNSFSCNVSNRVSSMSSDAVQQTCITRKLFPDKLFGINTWIIVGAGGGVVLLLIIVVIVCCVCTRRKKRMQLKDEGELRLAWTNEQQQHLQHQHQHNCPPDQQHHHHHHQHPQQQQPAGHTGPRQHRSKQPREQQRPRAPEQSSGRPQPSPRRPAQAPRPADTTDEEQPPPLPQPRKKGPRTTRA